MASTKSYPQPTQQDGFSIIVTATVQPDRLDEFLAHFHVAVQKSAAEPECLSFEVFRSPEEPNKLKWVETWSKSTAWFLEVSVFFLFPQLSFFQVGLIRVFYCVASSNEAVYEGSSGDYGSDVGEGEGVGDFGEVWGKLGEGQGGGV